MDAKPGVRKIEVKKDQESKKAEEIKKIDAVVKGPVKTKKKSKFEKSFLADDIQNVKHYVIEDVLVPALKKAVSDIVRNGIDMVLYGEVKNDKKSRSSRISYTSYYERERDRDRDDRDRRARRSSVYYDYDDIILDTKAEAMEVLDRMQEIIDRWKTASVADLYDLVGLSSNYTDNKYGWTSMKHADIIRTRDGEYLLKMPRAIALD